MRALVIGSVLLLSAACTRQPDPPATPESQADNAAASAPNGVGAQQQGPPPTSTPGTPAPAPPAGDQQTGEPGQTATSRSGGDRQGLSGSSPR